MPCRRTFIELHSPVANMVAAGCGWSRGLGIMLQLPVDMGGGGGGAAWY